MARQTIRLFNQFTSGVRVVRAVLDDKTKVFYADGKATESDDVYLENENELLYTNTQKKEMIFKLYESGLLSDDSGRLRPATKEKVLALLGYKDLDYQKGIARLQEEKAQGENQAMLGGEVEVDEIDDHSIHSDEHTRYFLSEHLSLTKEQKQNFYKHIKMHKDAMNKEIGEN